MQAHSGESETDKAVAFPSRKLEAPSALPVQTGAVEGIRADSDRGTAELRTTILADALLKIEILEKELAKTRLMVATALASGEIEKVDDRRLAVDEAFATLVKEGSAFASKSRAACRMASKEIDASKLGESEKARLKCGIDEIAVCAERFAYLARSASGGQKLKTARIIDVNTKLGVVLLSTGYADGTRCGLLWMVKETGGVQLKVVSARQNASAATVIAGDIGALAPGMLAVIGGGDER